MPKQELKKRHVTRGTRLCKVTEPSESFKENLRLYMKLRHLDATAHHLSSMILNGDRTDSSDVVQYYVDKMKKHLEEVTEEFEKIRAEFKEHMELNITDFRANREVQKEDLDKLREKTRQLCEEGDEMETLMGKHDEWECSPQHVLQRGWLHF